MALLIVILTLTCAILLFSYFSAGKIHRLEPINAIRGIAGDESVGQNILLFIVSFGIMVLLSFAGTLLYNVNVKPDNFMNTLSKELLLHKRRADKLVSNHSLSAFAFENPVSADATESLKNYNIY